MILELHGSGPGHKPAFDDALAQVSCPDRRIDQRCLTCCSPFQPSHRAGSPARSGLPQALRVACNARPWPSPPRPSARSCWQALSRRPAGIAPMKSFAACVLLAAMSPFLKATSVVEPAFSIAPAGRRTPLDYRVPLNFQNIRPKEIAGSPHGLHVNKFSWPQRLANFQRESASDRSPGSASAATYAAPLPSHCRSEPFPVSLPHD